MEVMNSISIVSYENNYTKSDEKVCAKTSESYDNSKFNWKVVCFEDVPDWLQHNKYLRSYYRPVLPTFELCFWSIFRLHNQTTNIWSHLLGALLFNFLLMNYFPQYLTSTEDRLVFSMVCSGVILSFYGSTIFHTFLCHSEKTASFVAKIDYYGVSLHIFVNIMGLTYFTYYCQPLKMKAFLTFATLICVICLCLNALSFFDQNTNFCRIFRSIVFFSFAFISIVPQITWFLRYDWQTTSLIQYMIIMDLFYVLGVILYASRFPECYFVGKCDIFHSHMWFHILIVGGSYYCYKTINEIAIINTKYPCQS